MFKKTLALLAATVTLAVGMGTVALAASCGENNHTWVQETVKPTCGKDGAEVTRCLNCGEIASSVVIPATKDHKYVKTETPATCTKDGKYTYTCSVCHTSYTEDIPMLNHPVTIDVKAKDPTCTESGLTAGVMCDVCHTMIVKQNEVPKLGHDWSDTKQEIKAATCIDTGIVAYVCSRCPETKGQTVTPKTDHVLSDYVVVKPATCTENGLMKRHCTFCSYEEEDADGKTILAGGHQWGEYRTTTPATCTADGEMTRYCMNCVTPDKVTKKIPAKGHTFGEYVVTKPAPCPATLNGDPTVGYEAARCVDCTYRDVREIKGEHKIEVVEVIKEAKCGEAGVEHIRCTKCKLEDKNHTIPALSHSFTVKTIVQKQSCTTHEMTAMFCANGCGKYDSSTVKTTENLAIWHKNAQKVKATATCTEKGHKGGWYCPDCGKYSKKDPTNKTDAVMIDKLPEVEALGHDFTPDAEIHKEATCVSPELWINICNREGCVETKSATGAPIDPNKHSVKTEKAKAPTCVAPGYQEYKYCELCGNKLSLYKEIPAKGHTPKYSVAVEPTCTTDGHTAGAVCKDCDTVLIPETVLPATGHIAAEEYTVITKATCTQAGVKVLECDECGVVIEGTEKEIKALGHKFGKGEVTEAATCTETGLMTYTCIRKDCDGIKNTKTETIPMAAHTEKVIPGKAATCTETGLTDGAKCAVCGDILKAQEVIPTIPHTAKIIPGKAATCTETGLTLGAECAVCGETIVAQEVIPALGHEYVDGVCKTCGQEEPVCKHAKTEVIPGKAATCTATGLTDGAKCVKCGEIVKVQEVIPMAAHKAQTVAGKAATCTDAGLTDGLKCAVCGLELKAQVVIEAKGHEKVNVIPAVAATCFKNGSTEGWECANCDVKVVSKRTDRLEHKPYYVAPVAPTCTKDGHGELYACENCQMALTEYDVYMSNGQHTPVYGYNSDVHYMACKTCGEILLSGAHELVTTVSGGKVHTACKWCAYEAVKSIFGK